MARRRRDELERGIEDALRIGTFIDYRRGWDFVEDVEAVREKIVPLIERGEAARAVDLLETFIAASYEKSEEIDGSSGRFGQFVEELFCDWIRARQGAEADPAETASMLVSWMETDVYGYCHGLEEEAVKALDRKGVNAFERAVLEQAADGEKTSFPQWRKVEVLKAIHARRRDVDAYRTLCEADGDLAP